MKNENLEWAEALFDEAADKENKVAFRDLNPYDQAAANRISRLSEEAPTHGDVAVAS